MKMKTPLLAALVAGLPVMSSGFTLDAAGYEGAGISLNPLSVCVPGYGEVIFEAPDGLTLVVNPGYENDQGFRGSSLSFDQNEAVKITFNGTPPWSDNAIAGMSTGEDLATRKDLLAPRAFPVTHQSDGDGASLNAIERNAESIPEPASVLLGLIGTAVFAFRRRR